MMESRCGLLCGECRFHAEGGCQGCVNIEAPFWGACPVKNCCESKELAHCGLCREFPCQQLTDFAYDAAQGDNGRRIEQCRLWREQPEMRYHWLDEYVMAKQGVTRDFKAEWGWLRYQIGGKLFAAVCLGRDGRPYYITMKLEPLEGELLRGQYGDIVPGYYCDKRHWVSVRPNGRVPDQVLRGMLDRSYQLVLSRLSGKKREELTGNG